MIIPKVIHYCWFGKTPLPNLALKCIESWRIYLPDYEIKEWNEDNFDVNIIPYTEEAYKAKKYAFVSDYARFWILYKYGGVYFDTDVEVIRPMDCVIQRGAFMGCETDGGNNNIITVAPGLGLGSQSGNMVLKEIIDVYANLNFVNKDGTFNLKTVVQYVTDLLYEEGLENVKGIQCVSGITIYPSEYFCPINIVTNRLHITNNTYTIHHYAASWVDVRMKKKIKNFMQRLIPESILILWHNLKNVRGICQRHENS